MSQQKKEEEQKEIEMLKSRKMTELIEHSVSSKRVEIIRQRRIAQRRSDREFLSSYLYDKGEEVSDIAEAQFPYQTGTIVNKIVKLIKNGEIKHEISGGELLSLFHSIGMKIQISTTIQIEDQGKLVSLADKLKQKYEELGADVSYILFGEDSGPDIYANGKLCTERQDQDIQFYFPELIFNCYSIQLRHIKKPQLTKLTNVHFFMLPTFRVLRNWILN